MSHTSSPTHPMTATQVLLWMGLIVGFAANGSLSLLGASPWLSSSFGVVALACGIVLILRKVRANETGAAR